MQSITVSLTYFMISRDNQPFKLENVNVYRHTTNFKCLIFKFWILEIVNFHSCIYFCSDAMFNETTSTEYIRSICGMDSLKNTTSILSDGLT